MRFPSGVECSPLLPPAVAFVLALVTAPSGLSGAFLLLPFQMSVLGFVSPAVTPTNLLYNLVALPGGVLGYVRERRMLWPLAAAVVLGTVPGVFAGAVIRVRYLPDPRACKLFVGVVLFYLAVRLLSGIRTSRERYQALPADSFVNTRAASMAAVQYEFRGRAFAFRPAMVFLLALVVGVVGGIYGIGGGAIIAPFLVGMMGLPVYTVAGAAMLATVITSGAGIASFELLARSPLGNGMSLQPDWVLGMLFGAGGLVGSYAGARLQRYLPERWIRLLLGGIVAALAVGYVIQYFR